MSAESGEPRDEELSEEAPPDISLPPQLVNALPDEQRDKILERFEQLIVHVRSGERLPERLVDVDAAERWETILPGSAKELFDLLVEREHHRMARQDRILALAEERNRHLIQNETVAHTDSFDLAKSEIDHLARKEHLGQWFAFISIVLAILTATYIIQLGYSAAGLALILVEAAGIAAVFVIGQRRKADRLKNIPKSLADKPLGNQSSETTS